MPPPSGAVNATDDSALTVSPVVPGTGDGALCEVPGNRPEPGLRVGAPNSAPAAIEPVGTAPVPWPTDRRKFEAA